MQALLDVNVLVALLDRGHQHHLVAAAWFARHGPDGWASCASTQNGAIRIVSHKGYANRQPVAAVLSALRMMCSVPQHEFWPDAVSLLDTGIVDARALHRGEDLTDLYLLALAVARGGQLVTFDRPIATNAVVGYASRHLRRL